MAILEALKNRRIWAAIFAIIAISLKMSGYSESFDEDALAAAAVTVIENISIIASAMLSALSYFYPKK